MSVFNHVQYSSEKENKTKIPEPSELRISTMTAVCSINSDINLEVISKYLPIDNNITYIEYANNPIRGKKVKSISEKKANKKRIFFNQITIIVKNEGLFSNIKLFNNGSMSMTGLKNPDVGQQSIKLLLDKLQYTKGLINGEEKFALEKQKCKHGNFDIVLINSDFYAGFEIKRNELHQLLISNYNIFSSYEPCIYPGVNSKYYWNKEYKGMEYDGKCMCTVPCNGKGTGNGNGDCKKITIAIFQSGSVIITGARNLDQVKDAYKFINNVFANHYEQLKKQNAPFLDLEDAIGNNKIHFKKNDKNIIYLNRDKIKIRYMTNKS
jgi:TATA-box binding protein (TBP) (component of TFIID and TFIIIB)